MKKQNFINEEYVKPEVQVVEMNNECAILTGSGGDGEQTGDVTMQDFGNWSVWGN